MLYISKNSSPIGTLTLASEGSSLVGVWMDGQKYYLGKYSEAEEAPELEIFSAAAQWLDEYFAGKRPDPSAIPLAPQGSDFAKLVWSILREIPYGKTVTYGDIAAECARRLGRERMSAQAVGGAVGHNPLSIIVPCHRVVGANGSLTGYAGGMERKIYLLTHEGVDMSRFSVPVKGTAI